jgi:hypothetical protein
MMEEADKITIIEGPTPTFELTNEPWMLGLAEGIVPFGMAVCRLRSHNGHALVERCYRAWRRGHTINLEYRDEEGLTNQAPIVAVRLQEQPQGHMLLLWIRVEESEIEIELDIDLDDFDDEIDDELDSPDSDPGY